jgi:hypothetical protein
MWAINNIKVVNKSKREYRERDVKENFFFIIIRSDIIGRIINNNNIGREANSNIAPIKAVR